MNLSVTIPMLVGLSVVANGAALLLWRWVRQAPVRKRLQYLGVGNNVTVASSTEPAGASLTSVVENIGTAVSSGKSSSSLRERLAQAGFHNSSAAAVYIGAKSVLMIFGALVATAAMFPTTFDLQIKCLVAGIAAMALFFIPNMAVGARRSRRCTDIRRALPGAIDLLEICASAGMGLDQAWNSVTDEVRSVCPTLADEMALTNLEMHIGASRADAIRHMAARTGAEDLSSMVAILVQSERFGTSVSEALRVFATSMRETRSQYAQESAEKMAVKLVFPMIVFIFPAVVLVMAGPAFISLYRVFAS